MNDTTLIVPDVHERWQTARKILDTYLGKAADRAIFLGDFLDSFFRTPEGTESTIALVKDLLVDDRIEVLLGNHELSYLWRHMRCAGFGLSTQVMVDTRFTAPERASLRDLHKRTVVRRGGFLISHAGFHPDLLPVEGYSEAWLHRQTQRSMGKNGGSQQSQLFGIGMRRGGFSTHGGPFWLDWEEFRDDPTVPPQIVGHTERREVRWKGRSVCLDTSLRHVGLLTDAGDLTVRGVE